MKQLLLYVHGVGIRIETDDYRFYDIVKDYYKIFLTDSLDDINISVLFSDSIEHSDIFADKSIAQLGEGLYVTDSGLAWENSFGFHCDMEIKSEKTWHLSGYHDDLSLDLTDVDMTKNFIRSMRWLIHFPLFEMLNRQHNIGLIHASAVANNNTSLVFSGLNKVGKSSLARYFVEKLGYDYLSDNFLLHNSKNLFAFPEKARLSEDAIRYYNIQKIEPQIYNKYQVNISENKVQKQCDIRNIYFVNNGKELTLKSIRHNEYKVKIDAAHRYLKEFSEYEYLSFLDIFESKVGKRKEVKLNASVNFFQLTIPLDWNLTDVVKAVEKCL